MKNHAFLITVHKQLRLLWRIAKLLEAEIHYISIYIDKRNKEIEKLMSEVKGISNVYFTQKRYEVHQAGISQIYAIIELLKSTKIYSNVSFEYYHTLSGQDYPLRSTTIINNLFENNDHSYMYIDEGKFYNKLCSIYKNHANEWHFNNTDCPILMIYEKMGIGKILSHIIKCKKIEGIHGGWDWFSWNKNIYNYVMDYLENHPNYIKRFNHTRGGIELIFSILLYPKAKELKIEISNLLRYISWHPHRLVDTVYRPFKFNEQDFKFIIDSKAFFCRKVDEVETAKLLNLIDEQKDNTYNINVHQLSV